MEQTTTPISNRLTDEQIQALFINAFEGGSSYWCGLDIPSELREKYKSEKAQSPSECVLAALLAGETVEFFDQEDPSDKWSLTLDKLREGTEKFFQEFGSNHYADVMREQDDATTADVWFQMCLIGELTFG